MGPSRFLLSKPTIAAVEGYAVAGGLELSIWCDLRVAAEDAVFGVFCRRWGVPLIDGGTVRLPRLIGHSHALDMILTGRPVSGEEALRMGLANRIVPKGTALAAAVKLAKEIAAFRSAACAPIGCRPTRSGTSTCRRRCCRRRARASRSFSRATCSKA
jgi:enoyl-CoA hydratase